jgi:hypothetical protein
MENINVTLDKALEKKDLDAIRRILSTFITADQSFSKGLLDERLRYCVRMGVSEEELFVPFDGGPLNENPTEWNIDYFAKQRVRFNANFSRERLEHLRQVGKKLFPKIDREKSKDETAPGPIPRTGSRQRNNNAMLGGAIVIGGAGAVAGGIAAAVSGSAVLGGVLIGGIIGAAVGAGAGAMLNGKE